MQEQSTGPEAPQEPQAAPTLDYRTPGAKAPQSDAPRFRDGCLFGICYSFLALGICWWVMASTSTHGPAPAWAVIVPPVVLLGGPFVAALCKKDWRGVAAGIGLTTCLVLLVVGACAAAVFHGL
jgi:hypothetical protein